MPTKQNHNITEAHSSLTEAEITPSDSSTPLSGETEHIRRTLPEPASEKLGEKGLPQELAEGIDLVYTWVDGNDPVWREKHDSFNKAISGIDSAETRRGADCTARYADNDELKYSLRSVELYAPWIRKIFIVTDSQIPSWLNTEDPRIRIVDHKEIIPEDCLPTFNSVVIEHCIHKIPGLAEHFLYANDDMFFNRPVEPNDFFTTEGRPIIRMNRRPMRRLTLWMKKRILGREISVYNRQIENAASLIESRFKRYFSGKPHHNVDAYSRSGMSDTAELFRTELYPTLRHHKRKDSDIQRCIYSYAAIAQGYGKAKYVSQKTSFRLHTHRHKHYERLEKWNPMLFCINDSEFASDDDRQFTRSWLRKRFPKKSSFEKDL